MSDYKQTPMQEAHIAALELLDANERLLKIEQAQTDAMHAEQAATERLSKLLEKTPLPDMVDDAGEVTLLVGNRAIEVKRDANDELSFFFPLAVNLGG